MSKVKKLVSVKDENKTTSFTIKGVLKLNKAIELAINSRIDDSSANYALARGLKKCKAIVEDYREEEEMLYKAYSSKDKNGVLARNEQGGIVLDPTKINEVEDKLKELQNKEVEVEFHLIERTEETDKINANALAELLDVIIVEKD